MIVPLAITREILENILEKCSIKHFSLFLMTSLLYIFPVLADAAGIDSGSAGMSGDLQLAVHYEHGEGVRQDYSRAKQLYCEEAARGNPDAFFNLGWMYANGRGVDRDDGIAVAWWRKASAHGIAQAANLLEMLRDVAPAKDLGCADNRLSGRSLGEAPAQVRALVRRFAGKAGLDPELVLAVIAVELNFDPLAISRKRAMGLMQLTSGTAERFGVRHPFDPEENVRGGTTYLRWLIQRFRGDLVLALAGYNAGEQTVDFYGGVPPFTETKEYIRRVRGLYPFRQRSGSFISP